MAENIPNPPRLLDRSSAIKLNDTVVITDVVGTDIFTITNPASSPDGTVPAGQPEGYPILLADKRPLESLFDMYMTLGPGDHSLDDAGWVYARTRVNALPSIIEEATELDELMPDTAFKFLLAGVGFDKLVWRTHETAIHIGDIAIAARRPTKDEAAQAKHREMQRKREELDKDKLRYTDYDHAVITVGDRRFFLPTDRANTILAARIIHFLANATPNRPQAHTKASKPYFDGQEVVNGVWDAMHTDERLMFAKKDEDVFKVKGKSLPIGSYVVSILEQLTNQLGITRQTTGGRFQLENKPSIAFSAAPPAENEDWTSLTPVFAPGTPREHVYRAMGADIPNEAFLSADMLLNEVVSTEPLDHPAAIRVLDLIIDRDIKRAIRSRLGGDNKRLAEALDVLSERVRHSLDESFPIAYRDRLIGGHSAHGSHGGVRQVTGRLPITTQPPVDIITRWRVGVQSR